VITQKTGPPWSEAPDWVGWWACERNGISWFWEREPIREGRFWLPEGGRAPVFAGRVEDATLWWQSSKLKKPVQGDTIFIPLVEK
jgi:hypothetical protein